MSARSPKPSTSRSLWEEQRAAIRQSKATASPAPAAPRYTFPPVVPAAPEAHPDRGAYRIDQLQLGQCRFPCTPHGARTHLFCGDATEIGSGNLHGSWCPEHLAVVVDTSSRLAQPAFLKNTVRSVGR